MKESECIFIGDAARRIDVALMRQMGNTGAPQLSEVKQLATDYGIELEAVRTEPRLRGEIERLPHDRFKIRYNATLLPIIQMIILYHEIAEVLAATDHPGLFDSDPSVTAINYDGASAPLDTRHLVAIACEHLLIERLKVDGTTIPKSLLKPAVHKFIGELIRFGPLKRASSLSAPVQIAVAPAAASVCAQEGTSVRNTLLEPLFVTTGSDIRGYPHQSGICTCGCPNTQPVANMSGNPCSQAGEE